MSGSEDAELRALRLDLLGDRPRPLGPEEGLEAFREHKILATAVHRATLLDKRDSESQTQAWLRYVTSHFPPDRNDEADALSLWTDWRTALLKDDCPGPGIAVTHGRQRGSHWRREAGRLWIDLESMWDDFDSSVDRFITALRHDPDRQNVVLARFRRQQWGIVHSVGTAMGAQAASGNQWPTGGR